MKLIRNIADLVGIAGRSKHIMVLFNGSVDSTYILSLLSGAGCRVTALVVDFGGLDKVRLSEIACYFPVNLELVDGKRALAESALKPAICANFISKVGHPNSLSLVRPILADIAVNYANLSGCEAIVHGSNHSPNSAFQINTSINLLGFEGAYGSPYDCEALSFDKKQVALFDIGLRMSREFFQARKSNFWCRSYEVSCTNDTEDYIAEESLFSWTKSAINKQPELISITFSSGLPTHVNNKAMDLITLIEHLNHRVGAFGIGRFVGPERQHYGKKTLEVREAPAAFAILETYRCLENVSLSSDMLQKKKLIEATWANEVVEGLWFGCLKKSAENLINTMSKHVEGTVNLSLFGGALKTTPSNLDALVSSGLA